MRKKEDLRKLIFANPELPVIFVVTKDEEDGTFIEEISEMFYENPEGYIGEVLDHKDFVNSRGNPYIDREEFEDDFNLKAADFEAYWKKCIIVEV